FLLARGSSYDREQPVPAHGPRPAPYHPGVLALTDGEEDDLSLADDVLERHIANLAEHATIGGIVAVVAHHEEMARGHLVDRRIVVKAVVDQIERRVAHPIRQSLPPPLDPRGTRALFGLDEVLNALPLDWLAIDMQHAVDHLDAVAGQANDPLDVVRGIILRQSKHDDITAVGLRGPDAPGEQRRGGRQTNSAGANRRFLQKKKKPDQKRQLP